MKDSSRGNKYYIAFTDERSNHTLAYPISLKSDAPSKFRQYRSDIALLDRVNQIQELRTDNAPELSAGDIARQCAELHIRITTSAPGSPAQNGRAERKNRTIKEGLRICIQQLQNCINNRHHILQRRISPKQFWEDALAATIHTMNLLPKSSTGEIPLEVLTKKPADWSGLRPFGCLVYVKDAHPQSALDPRSTPAIFLGYRSDHTYRCYDPINNRVLTSKDVVFDELSVQLNPSMHDSDQKAADQLDDPFELPDTDDSDSDNDNDPSSDSDSTSMPTDIDSHTSSTSDDDADDDLSSMSTDESTASTEETPADSYTDGSPAAVSSSLPARSLPRRSSRLRHRPEPRPQPRRSTRQRRPPLRKPDFTYEKPTHSRSKRHRKPPGAARLGLPAKGHLNKRAKGSQANNIWAEEHISNDDPSQTPTSDIIHRAMLTLAQHEVPTAEEAFSNPEWNASMQAEIDSHRKNGTWTLVDLPANRVAIPCKWHFKQKTNPITGEVVTLKSRLVAQGFRQVQGRDYSETFAPVCTMASVRTLLAIAGPRRLHMHHLDVKTAFLQAELPADEIIYMKQPPFFSEPGQEHKVCLLQKGLYGLKQGQRTWNKKLDLELDKMGLQQRADVCVYVQNATSRHPTYLLVYVDDIIVASASIDNVTQTKTNLMLTFDIRDLGELRHFIGLSIEKQADGGYLVHQRKHIDDILEYFQMKDCKGIKTPMDTKTKLCRRQTNEASCDQDKYRTGIGTLLWLCNTRPDLSYPVSVLAKFVNDPSAQHWAAFKKILRYLQSSKNQGIRFKGAGDIKLEGWADADWCGDQDDRRSSGYLITLNGSPVSWHSRKQAGSQALSTTEAEYISMSELCQDIKWHHQLLCDLGVFSHRAPSNLYINCDNQGAIAAAKNPVSHRRLKHVDVRYHFIRDCIAQGFIKVRYVPTHQNLADILTKPLSADKIKNLNELLGVTSFELCVSPHPSSPGRSGGAC